MSLGAKSWSEEDNLMLQKLWNEDKYTVKEISEIMKRTLGSIAGRIRDLRAKGWKFSSRSGRVSSQITASKYEVYRGDRYILTDTLPRVCRSLGIKESTARCYASPSFHERAGENSILIFKVSKMNRRAFLK